MNLLDNRIVGWLLGILIIAVIASWMQNEGLDPSAFYKADKILAIYLIPVTVLSVVLVGLSNQIVASHLGAVLRWQQWTSLAFASTFANHFLPLKAGLLLRAGYYSIARNLSPGAFTSITAMLYIVAIGTNSVFGIVTHYTLLNADQAVYPKIALLFLAALGACIIVLFLDVPQIDLQSKKMLEFSKRLHEGWRMCRRKPALLLKSFGINALLTMTYCLRLQLSFMAVGMQVSFTASVFVGALVALSGLVSITPAGLGIRELVIVAGVGAVGGNIELSLIAGLLDRLTSFAVVASLGGLSLFKVRSDMVNMHHRSMGET